MMVAFINLFFIPMIAVYLRYKFKKCEMKFDIELLSIYMISCSLVTAITRMVFYVLNFLLHIARPEIASSFHSVVAIIIATMLPIIIKNLEFRLEDKMDEKKEDTAKS